MDTPRHYRSTPAGTPLDVQPTTTDPGKADTVAPPAQPVLGAGERVAPRQLSLPVVRRRSTGGDVGR